MATLEITDDEVRVQLTPLEKVWSLRGDVTFPKGAVTGTERFDNGMDAVRGVRAPGLGLPGLRAVGVWRRREGKELVIAKRGQPAVRIELDDQPWEAIVFGTDDPDAVVGQLGA